MSTDCEDVTNAVFLIGTFLVAHLGTTAEEAWLPFEHLRGLLPYRDATWCESSYGLHVQETFRAIGKAMQTGLYDPSSFDEKEHFYCESRGVAG
jgi:hypothetical protein